MLNFFKTKAFKVGGLVVALMFALTLTVSAAWAPSTATKITRGSASADVMWLQSTLNAVQNAGLTVDGAYGKLTTAAIKVFQGSHPAAGAVDGIAGKMTIAALNAAGAGGSMGGAGVALCPNGMTLSSNCMTSPSAGGTVALCPNGMTIASNCMSAATTGTTASTGTNGYMADLASDSSNRVSTVYESSTDQVVAGFRTTARLADQKVDRVRVTLLNTNTSSSANLGKYITSASLWMGSTRLATMSVSQADRATSSDTYTFNFSGLNAPVAKDTVGRFYVSVNANGSLDSTDATNANWTLSFVAAGISASSPDGTYDTYPSGAIDQTGIRFGKFSSSGVKATVSLASTNPVASTLAVNSTTSATNGVTLLKFTVKATNSDLTLRRVPVQISSTTASVSAIATTFKLYRGTDIMDSADSYSAATLSGTGSYTISSGAITSTGGTCSTTACGYVFANLSNPANVITAGTTAEFTVVADLKGESNGSGANYADGETLTASLVNADVLLSRNFSIQDMNGDQLTDSSSSIRVGSAVGNTQTLRANGVNVVMGTPTYSKTTATSGDVTSVTYVVPMAVTSFGNTLYMGQSATLNATGAASYAFAYVFQNSSAPTTSDIAATATATLSTSDATIETSGFRLDSGTTKHFTLTVTLTGPTTANNSYRVAVKQLRTFTGGALVLGTSADQSLLPVEQFSTDYQFINN